MVRRDFTPHFSLKNMLKDARYALALAGAGNMEVPVLTAAAACMAGALDVVEATLTLSMKKRAEPDGVVAPSGQDAAALARRAGEIRDIADEFETLVAEQERILDVELTTAHELDDTEFGRIVGRIEQASGRKVQATRTVDPDLIGGIVLQAGSMRLDASVRGRLERLRQNLATTRS